jgi:drug/metabolite transporter (DMT)-like permease
MVACALMWSIAGVVSRWLDSARGFEVTFWRSAFNALALVLMLGWMRGTATLWRTIREGDRAFWVSAVCWAVMYTAFMLALTLTAVANVLITMALGPLFTAIGARAFLGHQLPARTWGAIVVAGLGIAWMYGSEVGLGDGTHFLGVLVALGVPLAAATNWTLMQHLHHAGDDAGDMLPAVLMGALLSAAVTLPLALPFSATPHDLGLLGLLGLVQLAIPCLLAMTVTRVLKAPEIALLGLLEVVFGVLWAWLGAGEAPSVPVLGGGALVLGALVVNEWLAMRGLSREPARA